MGLLLSADIGTTNVKAAAFDIHGNIAYSCSLGYPTQHPVSGYSEQYASDWYGCTVKAIKKLLSEGEIDTSDVICLSLTGHIRTVAFFDCDFEPVYPGIIWSDTRSISVAQHLNVSYGDLLERISGNRPDTNYALSNIMWLRQNEPQLWNKVRFLANPKDYVIYKLTGNFVSDASNQAGALLLDIDRKQWSDQLLSKFSIKKSMLPYILSATDTAGFITTAASLDTGLPVGMPVVVGGGDNDSAALGAGVCRAGDISVSLGTAGIILAPLDAPLKEISGKMDLFPHVIDTKWYGMGMIKAAGYAVEWLRRMQCELLGGHMPNPAGWLEMLGLGGSQLVPGSDGLFCFPYYQGKGDPDKRADVKGAFWGIDAYHSGRHFAQATMEGVAYCIRQCIDRLGEFTPVERVVCCGGGSTNQVWMEIIASVLGTPVYKCRSSDEGALGAAMLGAVAMELFDSVESAAAEMTGLGRSYMPKPEYTELYEELFARYELLSDRFWGR